MEGGRVEGDGGGDVRVSCVLELLQLIDANSNRMLAIRSRP